MFASWTMFITGAAARSHTVPAMSTTGFHVNPLFFALLVLGAVLVVHAFRVVNSPDTSGHAAVLTLASVFLGSACLLGACLLATLPM